MRDFSNEVKQLNNDIENFSKDLPALYQTIAELEHEAGCDGFWDNTDFAQSELRKLADARKKKDQITLLRDLADEYAIIAEWNTIGEATDTAVTVAYETLRDEVLEYKMQEYLSGTYDKENATITLHAGSGGTESCDFTDMMLRAITRWSESMGFRVHIDSIEEDGVAGVASATLTLEGAYAYGYAKALHGVFRLVRISPFDAAGRRHTSFMAVEVLPDLHITNEVNVSIDDCDIATFRSGGKGGQYQNKTDSGVRLTHRPTGLIVECREERSQLQNKNRCLEKLKSLIYLQQQNDLVSELSAIGGAKTENGWGNAICSIVLMPYQLVKDNRTGWETGDTTGFLDGELRKFIQAYLEWSQTKEKENDKS